MAIRYSSSGDTSFTIVASSSGSKTATLANTYPAGTYLIESKSGDTDLEIYLGSVDGLSVGYSASGAKSIIATGSFIYVTTVGANLNDAILFTLKQSASLQTKTDAYWAPPTITEITPSSLYDQNATTTITGSNFPSNVIVQFRKSDDSTLVNAKTVVRSSATSIIATRPDSFSPSDAPYDVIVTNPTTGLYATSLNSITAGNSPTWTTSATLPAFQKTVAYSQSVVATDADTSPSITYSQISATLPTGITFSNGTFSGTPTTNGDSYSAVIRATDLGGNYVDRTFTLTQDKPDAPTIGTATVVSSSSATISFTAPSYTGTSSIISYTATAYISGVSSGISSTLNQSGSGTITVSGLSASTSYTFKVIATNSSGNSILSSDSNSITTPANTLSMDIMIIGAGGAGSQAYSGRGGSGGGAGGFRVISTSYTRGVPLTVTIGAGGSSAVDPTASTGSSIAATGYSTISASAGGHGSHWNTDGVAGGSGSGTGNSSYQPGAGNIGGYTPPEGYAGGGGVESGGGGGAGGAGSSRNGGPGNGSYSSWASATSSGSGGYYASGGGGGGGGTASAGGGTSDGGGNATANTGGGGGRGGNGGSGLVIFRYVDSQANAASVTNGTLYTTGGYKYYKFNANGNITF